MRQTLSFALHSGYGAVDSMGPVNGVHHGLYGSSAAAFQHSHLFSASLGASGWLQVHPDDDYGKDKSMVGIPFLLLRSGGFFTPKTSLGCEIRLSVPGVFQKKQLAVESCLADNENALADIERIFVRFAVAKSGTVTHASVAPASLTNTPLAACVQQIAKETRFPPPPIAPSYAIPIAVTRTK